MRWRIFDASTPGQPRNRPRGPKALMSAMGRCRPKPLMAGMGGKQTFSQPLGRTQIAEPARTRFWEAMERLARVSCPLPTARRGAANWVTPELRVRARHLRCSAELRHAALYRLRRGNAGNRSVARSSGPDDAYDNQPA